MADRRLSDHPLPLDIDELAALLLTNGREERNFDNQYLCYTSKSAYIWVFCICEFVRYYDRKGMDTDWIFSALREIILVRMRDYFIQNSVSVVPKTSTISPYAVPLSVLGTMFDLPASIISKKKIDNWMIRIISGLENKGLIEDPLTIPSKGAIVFCLSLIPFSFTLRTSEGELHALQMKAVFWEMNYNSNDRNNALEFHIRISQLITALTQELPAEIEKSTRNVASK